MSEDQKQFEAWASEVFDTRLLKRSGIGYLGESLQRLWMAWQASRATQAASAALKLPHGWKLVPVEPTEDMLVNGFESKPDERFSAPTVWAEYDAMSGCQQAAHRALLCWQAMLLAAPDAPHIAPIEPICATGGAEWVSIEDEPPRDGSWCIAIEEGNFAGDVVYWENGAWKSQFGRDEYTHWMYHPAAPED